ncbi:MAG: serine--tRNA ligase [bacterium]
MIDLKIIRENPEVFKKRMKGRVDESVLARLLELDGVKRQKQKIVEEIRSKQKKIKEVSAGKELKQEKKVHEQELKNISAELTELLSGIPNIPAEEVPSGKDAVIKSSGTPSENITLPHWEIGKLLDIVDFETASAMTASFWPLLKGDGARLERALINFFIDENEENDFEPVSVPYLVNRDSVFGTGQLPKFEAELYKVAEDGLYLIPTGEVPAGNLFRERILSEDELPLKFQISTPCFRREAGSWGKLGKGLVRNHQFHKVEIFEFVKPENSQAALEEIVDCVGRILTKLGLPYRIVLLSSKNMGFSAAKTYDIEVWSAGTGRWIEVSSCSNCMDFQTRRTKTRFRRKTGEVSYLHSLNGSSLAVGRVFAAICENYWDGSGFVRVPDCLKKFIGKDKIERRTGK